MGKGKMVALVALCIAAGLLMLQGIIHGSLVRFLCGLVFAFGTGALFLKWMPKEMQPELE